MRSPQRHAFSQLQAEGLAEEPRLAITDDVTTKAEVALVREEMRKWGERVKLRLITWIVGRADGVTAARAGLILYLLLP